MVVHDGDSPTIRPGTSEQGPGSARMGPQPRPLDRRTYVRYGAPMHFEVDVVVQHPLDERSKRFLADVQRSANRVLRFRGDDRTITVTVEAHAYDKDGAVRSAVAEVARIYPTVRFEAQGQPRPAT